MSQFYLNFIVSFQCAHSIFTASLSVSQDRASVVRKNSVLNLRRIAAFILLFFVEIRASQVSIKCAKGIFN